MRSGPLARRAAAKAMPRKSTAPSILRVVARYGSARLRQCGSSAPTLTICMVRSSATDLFGDAKVLGENANDCAGQLSQVRLGNCESRRQIDNGSERTDENPLLDKALPQGVEILDAFEFDHADSSFYPHIRYARELAAWC